MNIRVFEWANPGQIGPDVWIPGGRKNDQPEAGCAQVVVCKHFANIYLRRKLEPMSGIEPPTYGLRNRCSTTELHWLKRDAPILSVAKTLASFFEV